MNAFRFIHAADLHLDSPFRGLAGLSAPVRNAIRESTFRALSALVETALRERVDFILIAGDIYDAADRSLRAQLRLQRELRRLGEAGVHVYIAHGNHDPEGDGQAALDWPATVHFFPARQASRLRALNRGGQAIADIAGISYASAAETGDLAARLTPGPDASVYQIALLHANVDGDPGHDNYAPCSRLQLMRAGFHYWALGHVHTRRVLCEDPWIVYPGNIQGRSVRETGARGCYLAEVSEAGETTLQFRELDAVRWFREEIAADGLATEQDLKDALEERLTRLKEGCADRSLVVRLTLTGRTALHAKLARPAFVEGLLAELRAEQPGAGAEEDGPFVWIESLDNRSAMPLDLQELAEQEGFVGDLIRLSERLLADEEQLAAFCGQAMEPLLSHAKALKRLRPAELDWSELLRAARDLAVESLAEDAGWEE